MEGSRWPPASLPLVLLCLLHPGEPHVLASLPRQLSEENANLQEHVEKEVEEKKRLSRTNEELLWKLQAGDAVSPVKTPRASSTSFYRCSAGNSSPAKARTVRR